MRPASLSAPVLLLALALLAAPSPLIARAKQDKLPASTRLVLDNGFEAILIPNRTAPLVTSVVVVRAGVVRETPATNGISHMLEHLLFNGTARRTQEQIYDEFDHYGIVNNAHTGAEHTAYFVMATREQFGRALDLQSDMLFGSIFPEEKLAKERDIIVNEIAKDRVADETAVSELYASRLYHPGGLELPVTGTPESVGRITRAAILDYYRAWYVPNGMTAIVMGDFEVSEMEPLIRRYFGAAAPAPLPAVSGGAVNEAALGFVHARRTEGTRRLLWAGAPAPGMLRSGEFERAYMLASLLGDGLTRAANQRLGVAGVEGSFLEAQVGLDAHAEGSTFQVRAELDTHLPWTAAARALLDEVTARLEASGWRSDDLDRTRLQEKASLLRLWEKPHYFGMDRAACVATAGWDLARDLVRRLSWVEPADLRTAARPLADPKRWAVFETGPDAPEDAGAAAVAGAGPPASGSAVEPTRESRELVARWKGPGRGTGGSPGSPAMAGELPARKPGPDGGPVLVRTVLPNGMLVDVDFSDDSRIFAAHVLIRNRSAAEPPGREGIVEMLHRMAGAGTRSHPGAALDAALSAIGGTLKVADDAGIPYDDIYLSPEYSYIRLEALDEFAPKAIELLAEILSEPALDDAKAFETAREQLLARSRQAQASPRERCRLLLARALWGETHPFGRPLFGTETSIRAISPDDLKAFHAVYFHPRNIIVGIGTSVKPGRLLPLLEARLGRWSTPASRGPKPAPPPAGETTPAAGAPGSRAASETVEAAQAWLTWGRLAPATSLSGSVSTALAAVLSRRMGDVLREKRGLAYALGAEAAMAGGRVQITASMGVLPAKVDAARDGLREVLVSMVASPPAQPEVDDATRAGEVRLLMRNLSRINRAYARCIEELRRGTGAGADPAPSRRVIPAEQVTAAARSMIAGPGLDGWVEAVVRPSPEGSAP